MRTRTIAAAVAVLLLTLSACGTGADATTPTPTPSELTQAQRDAARKAAGLPTEPSAEARAAFLAALNAIDPGIIKPGKEDQAVSRGLNQCGSIESFRDDKEKLSALALDRFTIGARLPNLNTPETGTAIHDAVRTHLCPDF